MAFSRGTVSSFCPREDTQLEDWGLQPGEGPGWGRGVEDWEGLRQAEGAGAVREGSRGVVAPGAGERLGRLGGCWTTRIATRKVSRRAFPGPTAPRTRAIPVPTAQGGQRISGQ